MLDASHLCTIYRFLDTSFLFSQLSVAKVGFSFIACLEVRALSVCMFRKSIFVSFVISYFIVNALLVVCFDVSKIKHPDFVY